MAAAGLIGSLVLAPGSAGAHAGLTLGPSAFRIGHGFTGTQPPTISECKRVVQLACYSPRQLEQAYRLRGLYRRGFTGKGRTVVIVDPFGSPTVRHDLSVFDRAFGLKAPPSFKIIHPLGKIPKYNPKSPERVAKAAETTGDVEAAHATAPGAKILLVLTPAAETGTGGGFPQMIAAENYVIQHRLGDVISQSFSLPEQSFPSRAFISGLRYAYRHARRDRVSVLAASNDYGVTGPTPQNLYYEHRVVYWPASDPLVTAVGGTRLHLDRRGTRLEPDTAWNDSHSYAVAKYAGAQPWASNGGVSMIFGRPAYQDAVRTAVGDHRGVPDVALSASFAGGVLIYGSFRVGSYRGVPGWIIGGGTSAATPEFAGIVAIADQYAKRRLGFLNPLLYRLAARHARGIVDVTRGNNTVSFPVVVGNTVKTFTLGGYQAKRGYDLVTGLGTVNASRLIPELACH